MFEPNRQPPQDEKTDKGPTLDYQNIIATLGRDPQSLPVTFDDISLRCSIEKSKGVIKTKCISLYLETDLPSRPPVEEQSANIRHKLNQLFIRSDSDFDYSERHRCYVGKITLRIPCNIPGMPSVEAPLLQEFLDELKVFFDEAIYLQCKTLIEDTFREEPSVAATASAASSSGHP